MTTKAKTTTVQRSESQLSNEAASLISIGSPYIAEVTIQGVAPLLFHAWNAESIAEKSAATKNSKIKKTDDIESYVYRTASGHLGIAGKCLHGSILDAAKFIPDPRSARRCIRDLCKAAIVVLDTVAPLEPKTKKWDYEDHQRVTIQRAGVTRIRPAMQEGWKVSFHVQVLLPEYISPDLLALLISKAGAFSGVLDFRPTYGRFRTVKFDVIEH